MGLLPRLIDSHCHFDDARFDQDREQTFQRARDAGVTSQIIAGVKAEWWPRQKQVCRDYPRLYPAYGLHPMFLGDHQPQDLQLLASWIEREQPVAVGECGLDFFIKDPQPEAQQALFEAQLELARDYRLPVIIHARRSVDQVFNSLKQFPGLSGVVHSFSGSEQQARRLIDLGFLLSFGGPITYERAKRLRSLIQTLPLESLMLETDAPDQPDSGHRGERNESAYLPTVLQTVAELRNQPASEIAAITSKNAVRLFNIPTSNKS
ncbi:MAG: TatD family hydrolase [gamma proteobacterium endosymbiont of Lamellibrachia anaximandri]|nr:TatD family hydrolase [gamma proteobacterium endosymbiont of Lamellibrachia anaximandri]MBL3533924.1 TatD family hydrolase [gamma proteobacterium endosymbiont of Lamellibrachia anaximandri]